MVCQIRKIMLPWLPRPKFNSPGSRSKLQLYICVKYLFVGYVKNTRAACGTRPRVYCCNSYLQIWNYESLTHWLTDWLTHWHLRVCVWVGGGGGIYNTKIIVVTWRESTKNLQHIVAKRGGSLVVLNVLLCFSRNSSILPQSPKCSQNSPPKLVTHGICVSFWHKICH